MKVQRLISIVVISSYMVKSGAKLLSGFLLGIPAMIADGLHSFFDIVEHSFLAIGGYYARKQNREKYPLDRQPLIDLLGLIVYAGLIVFGITLLWDFFKLVLFSLTTYGILSLQLPDFIRPLEINIDLSNTYFLLIAAIVMLGSFVISEMVYRFEIKLAREHRIREMIADAIELRSDGWIELSVGLGFLFSWIFIAGLKSKNNDLIEFVPYLNGIILGGLGLYLIIMAWPEFWENFNNLMNRALEKNERFLLQKNIDKRLPIGCGVIEPLVCYHRGDQLFIKGHLSIEPGLMNSADLIIRTAELITKTFFADSGKIIYPQFSPFFAISEKTIDLELEKVLSKAFKISGRSPAGEAFKLLRKGDLDKSIDWAENNIHKDRKQELLSQYIQAEVCYRKLGAENNQTQQAVKDIHNIVEEEFDNEIRLFFISWLLIFYSGLQSKKDTNKSKIIILREKIKNDYLNNPSNGLDDYLFAEACFSIGFSWERSSDYDLDLSREYYRKAEYFYKRGGYRSEMDRLYNTWGHFETLTYSLGDAEMHLNFVQEIREIKKDLNGLTFTYGCLGDLYGKMGNFQQAKKYYSKDIDLLKQLNIEHSLPWLSVKKADMLIKEGLLHNNPTQVTTAIDLCNGAVNKLNYPFFAFKGITKGLLGLAALHQNKDEIGSVVINATEGLDKASAVSQYEKAFWHRLKGRLAGYKGNFTEANNELTISRTLFSKMKDPIHEVALSIQATVSGLEIYKWSLLDERNEIKPFTDDSLPLNSLKNFIASEEGMLGSLPNRIKELLLEYELARNNMEKRVKVLDRLIWFLEG